MTDILSPFIYILFILAINALSEPKKAYKGNKMAILAMILTLVLGFSQMPAPYKLPAAIALIAGGAVGILSTYYIKLPNLPQMVALLNGFGGFSAGIIGITEVSEPAQQILLILLIISIGFITFSGSLAAFLKLGDNHQYLDIKTIRSFGFVLFIMIFLSGFYASSGATEYVWGFALISALWGFFFILPIGAADMSIIISVLNSLSGWCTVLVGFSQNNSLLIIVGTIIGASGAILSFVMTKAMNRNLIKVLFTLLQREAPSPTKNPRLVQQGTPEDAAFLLENAQKVIIVPGFGMAAAYAQNEVAHMAQLLRKHYDVTVKFAIHPVAGRMPGHMNVLLAEANVNTDDVFELKDINQEFKTADVAYVIGANDITNPAAKTDSLSPIYQMPILEVADAKKVLFVKRSLGTGYAQIDNPLFYEPNTIMLLGDAKDITKKIVTILEENP